MAGTKDAIGKCVKCVGDTFDKSKLNKHTSSNCAARRAKDGGGSVSLDQDESITQLRPIRHPEFTGEDADAKASTVVAGMFVSLRGALAYALC
eukprot:74068-Pyramimonas_sp.AAC.1